MAKNWQDYSAITATLDLSADDVLLRDKSDTTDHATEGTVLRGSLAALFGLLPSICNGRLTTETGVPVSTSDRTAQSTIYFTPYQGNRIVLFDGTRWELYSFSELSLALSGLTSDKNYDVFIYDNAGTLTLELSAAWTNDTTRADALVLQDGVYVKSGATTRRYLGTIRTTATTTTEDSRAKRFVWNLYNHRSLVLTREETTSSWTYTTATFRQARANSDNRVEVVVGLAISTINLLLMSRAINTDSGVLVASAIGEDSTTTPSSGSLHQNIAVSTAASAPQAEVRKIVPLGYHAYNWLEYSQATGTTTWTAISGASPPTFRTGLRGTIEA